MLTNVEHYEHYPKYSLSEHRTLVRCSYQHGLAYRQGLVPASTPSYFARGTFIHRILAYWLEAKRRGEDLDLGAYVRAALVDMTADGTSVPSSELSPYAEQVKRFISVVPPDFGVVEVEQEFYADVGLGVHRDVGKVDLEWEPVLLHGVIDAVIRIDGELWVVEHKTASRKWGTQQKLLDLQGPVYAEVVANLLGERPAGVIFNFFYPNDYDQEQVPITAEESRLVLQELQGGVNYREANVQVRSEVYGCGTCSFKDICASELKGHDTSFLREMNFRVDEEKKERFHD